MCEEVVLLDLFKQLPTNYLICAFRLATPRFKRVLEGETAQEQIWKRRAQFFEKKASQLAHQCIAEEIQFESHTVKEIEYSYKMSPLERCIHYYRYLLLWCVERKICGEWAADYYVSTGEMHRYWIQKHEKALKFGDAFNELDTETASRTVETSRSAALQIALETHTSIPYTEPIA